MQQVTQMSFPLTKPKLCYIIHLLLRAITKAHKWLWGIGTGAVSAQLKTADAQSNGTRLLQMKVNE
jgi:hypothetical protein